MKTCPNCGMGLEDDDVFCPSCGTAIPSVNGVEDIPPTTSDPEAAPASSMNESQDAPAFEQIPPTAPVQPGVQGYGETRPVTPAYDQAPYTAPARPAGPASFCPNCGQALEPGAVFCPNCGAVVGPSAPAAPAKSKKTSAGGSKKIIGIAAVAACAVLVLVLAIAVIPAIFSSDADRFVSYHENLLVEPALDAVKTGMDEVQDYKLSTDLTVTASTGDRQVDAILDDSSVVLKLDVDGSDVIINAVVNFMGSEMFAGTFTVDKEKVGFYLPQADDTYYTMNISDIMALATEGGLDENVKLPDISGKQLVNIVERYLGVIFKTVNKDNLTVEKDSSYKYTVLKGRFEGTVYTFKPSATDIEDLVERLADELEGDKDVKELLISVAGMSPEVDDPEGEVDEVIARAVDSMRDNARDLGRAVKAAGFEWVLAVEGKQVRAITVAAGDTLVGYETKGDEKEGLDFALYTMGEDYYGDEYTEVLLEGDYTRDGDKMEGAVTVDPEGYSPVSFSFDVDMGDTSPLGMPYGTYELGSDRGGEAFVLEVSEAKGGADHTLTFEGDLLDTGMDELEINIFASKKGTAKKPKGKEMDISGYDMDDLSELFYELGETLGEDIAGEMGGFLG